MEIKIRYSSNQESIWFYALKVDYVSDLSIMTCDGALSDGPIRIALNFY